MLTRLKSTSRTTMLMASALMVGVLGVGSVVLAGPSGAATPSASATVAHPQLCAQARQRKVKGEKLVATFTKREARAERWEAAAKAHGHTARAAYFARIVAREQSGLGRAQKRVAGDQRRVSASAARLCRAPTSHASTAKGSTSTS